LPLFQKEPSAIEHQQKMPVVPSPDELSPYFELVRRAIQDHESGVRPLRDFRLKHLNHHLLEV
jgi:acyl-CoA thioesterase